MTITCLIGVVVALSLPAKAGAIELLANVPTATQASKFRRNSAVLKVAIFMAHPQVCW